MQGREGKKFFYLGCHSRLHEHIHAHFMQVARGKNSQDLVNFTSLLQAEIYPLLDPDHYVHRPSLHEDCVPPENILWEFWFVFLYSE